jgi:hypothetical protein
MLITGLVPAAGGKDTLHTTVCGQERRGLGSVLTCWNCWLHSQLARKPTCSPQLSWAGGLGAELSTWSGASHWAPMLLLGARRGRLSPTHCYGHSGDPMEGTSTAEPWAFFKSQSSTCFWVLISVAESYI